jgi:copper transport protein
VRRLFAVALLTGLALLPAGPAHAHAQVERTTPSDGEAVQRAPDEVTVSFNETVSPPVGAVRVYDAAGRRVDRGDSGRGATPSQIRASLNPNLAPGTYVVTWRAVSDDGHPVKGAFVFEVGADAARVDDSFISGLLDASGDRMWAILSVFVRWIGYLATLLAAGMALIGRRLGSISSIAYRRRLMRQAAWVGIGASLLAVPLFAAESTGLGIGAFGSAAAMRDAVTSSVGQAGLVRIVGLVAVLVSAAPAVNGVITAIGGTVALAAELVTGHTRTQAPLAVIMGADIVHVVAAAVWLAGLVALAAVIRGGEADDREVGRLTAMFSSLAAWTVLALTAAGVAMAWVTVRAVGALFSTAYGWTLVAKVAVVAGVLAVAAFNRRTLVPAVVAGQGRERLGRTVRIEVIGIVVVLALTSGLVALRPAAEVAGVTGPYSTYVPFGDGQLNLVVDPNRAGINEIHIYVLTAGGLPALIQGDATIEMSLPSKQIEPIVRELDFAGPGHFILTGPELALPGQWHIVIRLKTDAFNETVGETDVRVAG